MKSRRFILHVDRVLRGDKPADLPVLPRSASRTRIPRRKADKRLSRVGTVHSEMPLWGQPGYLLRRLHQIHYTLFFEECAGYDITPVQYGLLTTLSLNPNLDQNSLARELGIDRRLISFLRLLLRAASIKA
jgi:hypothetical protein